MSDLLPANATKQERAVSDTLDRLPEVIVKQVWNPDTCPANLLPWLAWAFSVDDWRSDWTEAQKRAVIKASVEVHEKKGTIGALKTGLSALGYNIDVTEWFQKEPAGDPYTFSLVVNTGETGIPGESDYSQIVSTANALKNLRSHLTGVDVLAVTAGSIHFGALYVLGDTITIDAEPV